MVEVNERGRSELTDRDRARVRVQKRHALFGDFVWYVVINLSLVVAWALTGFGYFWPGWVMGCWGVFLLLNTWSTYWRRPVTEDEVDEELRRYR